MYADLVLVRHEEKPQFLFLFEAPAWSSIEARDEVMVDTKDGLKHAVVEAVCTVQKDSSDYWFIVKACKAYAPLKRVRSKVMYREYTYEDEEETESE